MELVRLTPGTVLCASADALYQGAFPDRERAPLEGLHEFSMRGCASYFALVEDGFKGLAYIIESDDLVFLLYLAVSPSHRGGGCGTRALDAVKSMCHGRRLFLNSEPLEECDNYDQRVRRLDFYRRNGFTEHGVVHTPDGEHYMMMCFGGDVSDDEVAEFYDRISLSSIFENPGAT